MKSIIKKLLERIARATGLLSLIKIEDLLITQMQESRRMGHPNTFVRYGAKCFSQTDEDGITMEIVRRLSIKDGRFIEFGVGTGLENNTLCLLANGWKGNWIGGQDLCFDTGNSDKLAFEKAWITRENIIELYQKAREGHSRTDLISMDLDGNDYHLAQRILEHGITPAVFIIEYNAKFIPPTEFVMEYSPDHRWVKDDYFGASLESLSKLFVNHGYKLICCNAATGANAFFVREDYIHLFPEVPDGIGDIYCSPFYYRHKKSGHPVSIKTITQIINSKNHLGAL